MSDNKYITFKREDWDSMHERHASIYHNTLKALEDEALEDAVVIRTQDAFAAAALHTYANSIAVAARCIGELAPSTSQRLQKIADYFHERAVEASDVKTKLPD